jgi:predicted metal-dependent phosphoesterase TrpH
MTPGNIAGFAKLAGYDVIALSDHNSTKNVPAFLEACRQYDIIGIPAIELNTREEVHVLCLFPDPDTALKFGDYVYKRLPDFENKPEFFGEQIIYDENNVVSGREKKLLINAADIGIYEVSNLLGELGGIAIPAHIDRASFSLISNLGLYDDSLGFDAVELSEDHNIKEIITLNPELKGVKFISNSDAHILTAIKDAAKTIETSGTKPNDIIKAIKYGYKIPVI